jgi:uncharacterized protein (DUF58 family)
MALGPDDQPSLLDRALQIAAALGYIALSNLDRVAVVPFDQQAGTPMRAVRGRSQFYRLLRVLSAIEAGGRTAIAASVQDFLKYQPRPGLVVLVSDFYDPSGLGDALRLLGFRGFEPMVLHLCDLSLLEAGSFGDIALVDTETGEQRDVTLTPALMAEYRAAFEAFSATIARAAREAAARCLQVDIAVPFDDVVLQVFRSGGFLR